MKQWKWGIIIFVIGAAMNLTVVAVDHGMPYRLPPDTRGMKVVDWRHHPERPSDKLTAIDDNIVGPAQYMISWGDMIVVVGLTVFGTGAIKQIWA